MGDDTHGYNVSTAYTSYFFREMAPDWLDFCSRANGFDAQRRGPSYRYLDLGCGQGFHLCVLAAANPEADFVGIDFQPEHIAHATEVARSTALSNVTFIQADFLDLAPTWPAEFGTYDYIALQGILSWISDELREADLECVAHASKPGTLAAFGYNSQPGWLNAVPFKHVASGLSKERKAHEAIDSAIAMFRRISDAGAPMLSGRIAGLSKSPRIFRSAARNYLVHEFLTEHWTALWHSNVAEQLRRRDLGYVGSATVLDNLLPDLLPRELNTLVREQDDDAFRQDVQDIVISQSFRRDILRKPSRSEPERHLDSEALVYLFAVPPQDAPIQFKTAWGELDVEYEVVADLVAALAGGPMRGGELATLENPRRPDTREILLRMLDAQMLVVGKQTPGGCETAYRFNGIVAKAAAGGNRYAYLAAGAPGSGIPVTELELLFLDTWNSVGQGDENALVDGVIQRLHALGRQLSSQGSPISEDEQKWHFAQLAQAFRNEVIPRWRVLGVIP